MKQRLISKGNGIICIDVVDHHSRVAANAVHIDACCGCLCCTISLLPDTALLALPALPALPHEASDSESARC
jgi:hypothetical protein